MAIIGKFERDGNDYIGTVNTLSLNAAATIKQVEKASEQAPDYRVFSMGVEVGAAWSKTSKAGNPYLSVKLGPVDKGILRQAMM